MGADGWIYIYDANRIDRAGLTDRFFDCFVNTYTRTIFGNRVYTAYGDTEHHQTVNDGYDGEEFDSYLIARWEVWT